MATTSSETTLPETAKSSIDHPSEIIISEDLQQAAKDHIAYLKEYYDHPENLRKQSVEYAIYRYEVFWLPFLSENSDLDITPPLDVLFVWHSHMLAPKAYASDCERIFGRILPNRVQARTPQLVKFSEQLWTKKYTRTMPYHLDYAKNIQVIPPYTSKIKYELSRAVERQAGFYYNVAFGHYQDPGFLNDAVERYKKFIYLKRVHPQLFVVPMYDIDLIWHTHQLFPESYRRDMMANLHHVLHHDDTTQDRSSNSKLSTSDHETRHKWFELYGDRLPKNGCMYRGKTSRDLYQYVNDFNFLLQCQRYTIFVQFIDDNHSSINITKGDLHHKATTVVSLDDHSLDEPLRQQFYAQFNSSEQEVFVRGSSGHVEAHFEADFDDLSAQLTLRIQQKAGYWPLNYFSTITEFDVPAEKLLPIIQFSQPVVPDNNSTGDDDPAAIYCIFDKHIEQNSPLKQLVPNAQRLVAGISALDINTVIVRYKTSEYSEVTLDENYITQLGTTFLFNLENVKVQQALHMIHPLHQNEPVLLNIRHTILNDIDIFTATLSGTIFASCHTLNWSQLPSPEQVSHGHNLSVITLNAEEEEALIIKDHKGDWGIVKFSRDLFTASLDETEDEKNYKFTLYRFMPDGHVEEEVIYVDWEDDKWLIGSKNFSIEMNTWSISIRRVELSNSMQYFCLGSAIISRFDTLFTQIFGTTENETEEDTSTIGNLDDNDLFANDIGKINLNGKVSINEMTNNKRSQVPKTTV